MLPRQKTDNWHYFFLIVRKIGIFILITHFANT
ncbi:hypothetical protein BB2000_1686 [Proteus mirabilis BB2000]|nr:hypothetical protein BB2000_1686 [Proteus mirabilis BB2000]